MYFIKKGKYLKKEKKVKKGCKFIPPFYSRTIVPIPCFVKISRSIEWLSLPSRICAVFTPFSTALIHVSIFGISEEAQKAFDEARKTYTIYNPVSFCYVNDENIVKTQSEILKHLEKSFEKLKASDETFREMISYQLANHEACITCDYTDALDALGMKFDDLTEAQQKIVKKELNRQIQAYCDAE